MVYNKAPLPLLDRLASVSNDFLPALGSNIDENRLNLRKCVITPTNHRYR